MSTLEGQSNEDYVEFLEKAILIPDHEYLQDNYSRMSDEPVMRLEHIGILAGICKEHNDSIKPTLIELASY